MPTSQVRRRPRGRLPGAALLASICLALLASPAAVSAAEPAEHPLAPRHRRWLDQAGFLLTETERQVFSTLATDFRRDAFIRRFWAVRDPDPVSARNELQRRWQERLPQVDLDLGGVADARGRFFLLNGPPGRFVLADGREVGRCYDRRLELEIWFYGGSDRTADWFPVIFLRPAYRGRQAPYELWLADRELRADTRSRLPTREIAELCAGELLPLAMSLIHDDLLAYQRRIERFAAAPEPDSKEWAQSFLSRTAQLPAGVETFPIEVALGYPGRNQSRTAVQGVVSVASGEAAAQVVGGAPGHQFVLTGEVVRDGALFETFRYRFELAASAGAEPLALVFQRYLRAGPAELWLKVEDLYGQRFASARLALEVPAAEGLASLRRAPDSDWFRLLAEANAATERGQRTIRILPPPEDEIQTGLVRFNTVTSGLFERVSFLLDGRPLLTKRRPPFSVELDLGAVASTHRLRVVAFDADGAEAASDEISINRGGQRFRVRLREPRGDKSYETSLSAIAQVEIPDGASFDRLELFLDERRVATLYQPPFVQPVLLERPGLAYVRAVAYLSDGAATEDVVFVNAPDYFEQLEVRYVELYASVIGPRGRPLLGLERDAFRVLEDGEKQEIRRFEYTSDLPIHAGILLDASASMDDSLPAVTTAALEFARQAIQPRDRLALIPFNHRPQVAVRFTNRVDELSSALTALRAEGGTALYDSLVFALHYFDGIKGQKALLVLSDGEDESSRFDVDGALEVARRAGVTVYVIGLKEVAHDRKARKVLERFAVETGGRSFFVEELAELDAVYASIQEELRSQYLLTYQSTSSRRAAEFRRVEVDVAERGAEVRTLSGYYP